MSALLALPHVAGLLPDGPVLIPDRAHLAPVAEVSFLDFQVLRHADRRELLAQVLQQLGELLFVLLVIPCGDHDGLRQQPMGHGVHPAGLLPRLRPRAGGLARIAAVRFELLLADRSNGGHDVPSCTSLTFDARTSPTQTGRDTHPPPRGFRTPTHWVWP